jgi:hypothetical protein
VRSLLHVSASDISFADGPDGSKTAKFDVLAVGFGDNGVAVDQLGKSYTMTLSKERYAQFLKRGFVYDLTFPVKKPGAYQLRIALKDTATNKIGSASQYVDVPNLKKKRLTLSGVALENISFAAYQKRAANNGTPLPGDSEPLIDTALRQFNRSSVINFGLSIHNFKPGANLTSKVTLYKEGKIAFATAQKPVTYPPADGSVPFMSSLSFPDNMELGEYQLQIDITDNNAKGKYKTATHFIQFEIVE